ncbi:MAG: lipoyl synthase [Nitrospinae bacterium]|nr:lipoyl synthase [Nitrospinota bacterium]
MTHRGATNNLAGKRKPEWLRKKVVFRASDPVKNELRKKRLNTVCESARCPNMGECFSRNTATFMILGDVCTRNCPFCAVKTGKPALPDPAEPEKVAEMARSMGLAHVVITSVTRDDLPDGGAGQFAATVRAVREKNPGGRIELLVPDFDGDNRLLDVVLGEKPDVLNHNVETVPSLYPRVRPRGDFKRSLGVLNYAAVCGFAVKSGIMVGLGETEEELLPTMRQIRAAGAGALTVGQYLAPSRNHAPVFKHHTEEFFEMISRAAYEIGFEKVAAGPFVRSSYMADRL